MKGPLGPLPTRVAEAASIAAGWALLGLSLSIALEIVMRKLFNVSLQGVDEVGGYVLAIASGLGFSYALATNAHVRIDMVIARMPFRGQGVAILLATSLLCVFAGILAWRAGAVALESWSLKATAPTPLKTPLVVPQLIWAIGLYAFLAFCVLAACRALVMIIRGREVELSALYAARPDEPR